LITVKKAKDKLTGKSEVCYGENYHGIIMIKSLLGWEEAGSLKSHGETQYNKIHLPDK
jgi:hypothetical protein